MRRLLSLQEGERRHQVDRRENEASAADTLSATPHIHVARALERPVPGTEGTL
jgi:hypothetical protein